MSNKCDITNKTIAFGGSRKHQRGSSGGGGVWRFKAQRTLRTWKPNLRKVKLLELASGKKDTYKISMKAYKKLRTGASVAGYSLVIQSI
ncbi:MAG: bL28 family ribosomal protein [bacterium]